MRRHMLGAALACVSAGCTSGPFEIAPAPPAEYRRLGPATGSACGYVGPIAYSFVAVGLNDRVARAHRAAVASVPGATGLVDVVLREDVASYVIFTRRCTIISGEAIQ